VAVLVLAAMGAKRIDVTWAGKMATFANMVAFPLFLLSHDHAYGWRGPTRIAAVIISLVGIGFGYYSLAKYVPIGKAALRDGRASRPT
jgi:phosphatidylglycerophosphate synthase